MYVDWQFLRRWLEKELIHDAGVRHSTLELDVLNYVKGVCFCLMRQPPASAPRITVQSTNGYATKTGKCFICIQIHARTHAHTRTHAHDSDSFCLSRNIHQPLYLQSPIILLSQFPFHDPIACSHLERIVPSASTLIARRINNRPTVSLHTSYGIKRKTNDLGGSILNVNHAFPP